MVRVLFRILLLGTLWFQFSVLAQDSPLEEELTRDLAIRDILEWKGEIQGVYERRTQLKILITRNHSLPSKKLNRDTLRKEILSQPWIVYQNQNKKELAIFHPKEVVWEKIITQKKKSDNYQAVLWGELRAKDKKSLSLVAAGSYIAKYREEYAYLEPHNFFQKKASTLPKKIIYPKDGKEMQLVDRGIFLYGQGMDSTEASFNPEFFTPNMGNLKEVNPFYMDKYEVTNTEYQFYLKETNSKPPLHWINGKYPEGQGDHPVDFLTYIEVEGYARWSGKRIPTEWEWEKAARGTGVDIYQNRDETLSYYMQTISYPFGEKYDPGLCNTVESGIGRTESVYDLPTLGASSYGIIGLCGNVPEWTSSWFESYPGQPFTLRGYGKMYKVVRGGSYRDDHRTSRVYHRSYGGIPNLKEDRRAGFRLVKDP